MGVHLYLRRMFYLNVYNWRGKLFSILKKNIFRIILIFNFLVMCILGIVNFTYLVRELNSDGVSKNCLHGLKRML